MRYIHGRQGRVSKGVERGGTGVAYVGRTGDVVALVTTAPVLLTRRVRSVQLSCRFGDPRPALAGKALNPSQYAEHVRTGALLHAALATSFPQSLLKASRCPRGGFLWGLAECRQQKLMCLLVQRTPSQKTAHAAPCRTTCLPQVRPARTCSACPTTPTSRSTIASPSRPGFSAVAYSRSDGVGVGGHRGRAG